MDKFLFNESSIVKTDFSEVEARLMEPATRIAECICNSKDKISCEEVDIYTKWSMEVFEVSREDVTIGMREFTKFIYFHLLYSTKESL